MKIVICRGSAFGGYPSEEQLQTYWKELLAGVPDLQITMRGGFNSAQADEIAGDNEALIGAWIGDDVITASVFDRHPNLKYVSTYAHGFGRFDHEAAAAHGVTFTNTVYGDETIAEFAMSLLLSICHHPEMEAAYYHDELAKGRTLQSLKTRQIELYEKTMGIIGLGRIGLRMAEMAHAFGMNVIAYNHHEKKGPAYDIVKQVSFDELLSTSDVISIHVPLNEGTRRMINADTISRMKDGVILINTARGGIIDGSALVEALHSGKVYAAGLDVVDGEPRHDLSPVFACDNALITGHIAWTPPEASFRSVRIAYENFINWMNHHPTSTI